METLAPGIQLAKSLQSPPSTGVWVYLDAKKNKLTFGSRDDTVESMPRYMAEFDIKPMRVQLEFVFGRPEWGTELTGTLKVANNEMVTLGANSQGATIEFRPRIGNDGSVSLQLTLVGEPDKGKSACVVRLAHAGSWFQILDGKPSFLKEGKLLPTEKVLTPPSGNLWQPFKIEVRASVLEK